MPMAPQMMVNSQAMQLPGMPLPMPAPMSEAPTAGPPVQPQDVSTDRPMGKPRLKRRTIADMCLEGQQVQSLSATSSRPELLFTFPAPCRQSCLAMLKASSSADAPWVPECFQSISCKMTTNNISCY